MNQMPPSMPSVAVKDLHLAYGSVNVLNKLNLDIAEGEFIVLLGPLGLRQVDAAQLHRRPPRHHRRADLHQGQERHLGGAEGPRHRHGVPVLRALPADDGAREPLVRAEERRPAAGTRSTSASSAPRRSCRSSRCSSASPPRSPAASASAWRSAGRWCATSTCSCSTSPCRTSTPSSAPSCGSRSSGCTSSSRTR